MELILKNFKKILQAEREQRKLTIRKLSEITKISTQRIQHLLTSDEANLTVANIAGLAKLRGQSLTELMSELESETETPKEDTPQSEQVFYNEFLNNLDTDTKQDVVDFITFKYSLDFIKRFNNLSQNEKRKTVLRLIIAHSEFNDEDIKFFTSRKK